jgi:hypothetical protein
MASTLAETARRYRAFFAVLVAFSMVASLFGAAVLTARAAQAQPVFLEPAHAAGEDPFVPSLLDPGTAAQAATVPEMAGTGDQATCDPATLTAYLDGHPDAASAWTAALNADATLKWSGGNKVGIDQISAYVAELTPAVLGGDMQVTNHRFADGVLGTVQSVLQEGTAVLVDADGTPRVRCACGNPLAPAAYTSDEDTDNEYVGEPWDGFTYDDADDADADAAADADAQAAWNGNDHDWDRPVADDCRRGEYRDDDGNCVRNCPRGTWRDDDGRCRAPIDRCDVKDHEKPDWCKPRPGCTPPSRPDAPVAIDSDRHGPPCHPQCPDGKKSRDDRCGGSPPDCPSAAEATSDNAEKTKHCQPSHPQPPPVKDKDPKDPVKEPVCQVVGTVASTLNKVVDPGTEAKPCTETEKSKAGAEGTPEPPEGTPPVDKKPTDAVPPVTENGQNPPVVASVPDVVDKVLTPPGEQPPTPPKADPPANTDPGAKPAPKPAEEPKQADPPPAAEGKADPPLPAVVKPLPIVGSAPEAKPAPAPEQAPPVVAPAPKKAAPEPAPAAAPPPKKAAVPDPVAIVVPKKETAAAPQPAPAPKPAPKPSPKPAPKPAPAAGPTCPGGTAMPAAGCTIPASGVPAGWVQKGARMVPA